MAALVELGPGSPLPEVELRRLLEELASDPPAGARGAQAAMAALRELERLDEPQDEEAKEIARLFDDRPDEQRVAEDDWHPSRHL